MKRALACIALSLLPCGARSVSAGADFLQTEIPARAAGMAGAFGAFHDDASAFLWNPSALGWAQEPQLSATHFLSIIDTTYDLASFIQPFSLGKTPGGLGLSVQYDTTSDLFATDLQGNNLGAIANHDFVAQAAYGFMLSPRFSLGLGLAGFSSELDTYKSKGAAINVGMQSKILDRMDLGISFVNIGQEQAYDSQADPLPTLLRLALKGVVVDSPEVMIQSGLEVDRPWTTSDPILLKWGAEYWYQGVMAFRAGWVFGADTGNLTLGAGFKWSGLSFDYAYVDMGDIGITQRFTLNVELGKVFEKVEKIDFDKFVK
jgi:hypothetical protein